MGTCANNAQAVGMAAVLCKKHGLRPAGILKNNHIEELQQRLLTAGQYIPGVVLHESHNLVNTAVITASSELRLPELPEAGLIKPLDPAVAQLVPLPAGKLPEFTVHAQTEKMTILEVSLRISGRPGNFTPDTTLEEISVYLTPGRNCIQLRFNAILQQPSYVFIAFKKNPDVQLHFSPVRITGILSVFNHINEAVSNFGKQTPPEDIGMDTFEFWCPKRRPDGENVAIKFKTPLSCFSAENIRNGIARPTTQPNAWVADFNDKTPTLTLSWKEPQIIREILLKFDTDLDHPMETVLMGHPENVMPFCVRNYSITADENKVVSARKDNYQTINRIILDKPIQTKTLTFAVEHPSAHTPAAIFEILCR